MTWRPLSTPSKPLSDGQPREGSHVVTRSIGYTWLEACGCWSRGRLLSPNQREILIPDNPEWLEVEVDPRPILSHRAALDWFASESEKLKDPSVLTWMGLGRLWSYLEESEIALGELELGRWSNGIKEEAYCAKKGPGWVRLQTVRSGKSVRTWLCRVRPG